MGIVIKSSLVFGSQATILCVMEKGQTSLDVEIPLKYAGVKAEHLPDLPVEDDVATCDGQEYHLSEGYLIPKYPNNYTDPAQERRQEELLVDRARKFFHMAGDGIDKVWKKKDIQALLTRYNAIEEPNEKASHARLLAGVIVNRMEQIGRVCLQENIDGAKPNLTEQELNVLQGDDAAAKQQLLESLKKEFSGYYMMLTLDAPAGKPDLLKQVRFRDGSPDPDGILLDLVREMGKALSIDDRTGERQLRKGIVTKIGWACASIDQLHEATTDLLQSHKVVQALRVIKDLPSYPETLEKFVQLARAQAGIRSEDAENSGPVWVQMNGLREVLNQHHEALQKEAVLRRNPSLSEVANTLEKAVQLIARASEARTPVNEHSPAMGGRNGLSAEETHDQSSVRLLEAQAKKVKQTLNQGAFPGIH